MSESTSSELSASAKLQPTGTLRQNDRFSFDDSIVRLFLMATLVWGVIATLVGVAAAALLLMPELTFSSFVSFGRLRPLLTNLAIFGFAGNAIFAGVYYSTQRLCKTRLASDLLSKFHFWGWQLVNTAALMTLPLGITQSKTYAELEWPIDLLIAVVWIVFFGVNFFMTLKQRRERYLYVSLWFYIAAIVGFAILHVVGNLAMPLGPFKSVPVYAGVQDALVQAWYSHGVISFFLTMPLMGLMYYFLPKAADRPVFSYRLCIVHFWSFVFISIWAGPHQLNYTSIASWMSSLGLVFSLMLLMPSWAGAINGLSTLRGAWSKVSSEPTIKFFAAGLVFFGIAAFERSLLSTKTFSAVTQYTDWSDASLQLGALGWVGFMAFGMLYWLTPKVFQTKLWNPNLASLHFLVATTGVVLYVVIAHVAGFTQSQMWHQFNADGYLAHVEFIETVTAVHSMRWLCFVSGLLYAFGVALLAVNLLKTWQSRPSQFEAPIVEAAPLAKDFTEEPVTAESSIAGVLNIGHKLDVWQQATWHRSFERRPMRLVVWTTIAIAVGSAATLLPNFLMPGNSPTIETVKAYSPLELAGRDIYIAEGCINCHSQQIRPLLADTERYGGYSQGGEFAFERPSLWGDRRIGPDLSREGGKRTGLWHFQHFNDPREKTADSVMPSFAHLIATKLDFASVIERFNADAKFNQANEQESEQTADAAKAAANSTNKTATRSQARRIAWELAQIGGPITVEATDGEMIGVDETQVVALIAYLQRLGTDILATEEALPERAPYTPEQQQVWDKYSQMLTYDSIMAADVIDGKRVYADTCGKCHQLFDAGGQIGPSLTGTNRWNRDYLLDNIVAPSREIIEAYRTEVVLTIDEIVVTGVIESEDDEILVLLTPDQKRIEIYQDDIEERKTSKLSLMPAGQLDTLKPDEVRSLFKYLQLPQPLEASDTDQAVEKNAQGNVDQEASK